MTHEHTFGGNWTQEKLARLRKYLDAYMKIMGKRRDYFKVAYIDAFAGTGYRTQKQESSPQKALLPEFTATEQEFLDGSARIALQTQPPFDTYIFIEKDPQRALELGELRKEYSQFDIRIVNADANRYLQELCEKRWHKHRAVLFLDPYGMQVEWRTIEAIAHTQAIDLWILFPLGIAVNRLLRKDGQIDEADSKRLDTFFGTHDWYDAFYKREVRPTLFGEEEHIRKQATIQAIADYFIGRLQTIFAGVAPNPLPLYNSRNNPLYLLCFAASNPKGAPTAVNIARHILGQ